ncbi:MAG: transposase [Nitrososphaeraceae archaeon]
MFLYFIYDWCLQKEETPSNDNTLPDDLWNEVKNIFPAEKPVETIGRPVVPFRKVLDGVLYMLRTGCQWKMLPKEYGSGSRHMS